MRAFVFVRTVLLAWACCASAEFAVAADSTAAQRTRATLRALVETPSDTSNACAFELLTALGWTIEAGDVETPVIAPGTPCARVDRADARMHGDLRVTLPRAAQSRAAGAALAQQLIEHPATVCAYAFDLGDATRRAADRLTANTRYRFTGMQLGWIGFGAGGPERDGWVATRSFGRGFQPAAGNAAAIEGFYEGAIRSECGVGRQIAQYATQYELHGAQGFDRAFDADELVLGTFAAQHATRSILLGSEAGDYTRDGLAVSASQQGRQAFVGAPGFIFHVFDKHHLDDINNQAENFVIYDVSDPAAAALRAHGGFEHYNRINRELWALARSFKPHARHGFERLLFERDPALRRGRSAASLALIDRMQALLDDPFYSGVSVYVHRQGVQPVAFHIARLLDINPRTPYRIELAIHNLHTTLFDRYIADRLQACETAAAR